MTAADLLSSIIKSACESANKEAFNISDLSPRRLLNVEEAAAYLSLSQREIYNMISNRDLAAVRLGGE